MSFLGAYFAPIAFFDDPSEAITRHSRPSVHNEPKDHSYCKLYRIVTKQIT